MERCGLGAAAADDTVRAVTYLQSALSALHGLGFVRAPQVRGGGAGKVSCPRAAHWNDDPKCIMIYSRSFLTRPLQSPLFFEDHLRHAGGALEAETYEGGHVECFEPSAFYCIDTHHMTP